MKYAYVVSSVAKLSCTLNCVLTEKKTVPSNVRERHGCCVALSGVPSSLGSEINR